VAGSAGVVVPAGDSTALGTAVVALLLNKEERALRSETGRVTAQRFRVSEVLTQYRALYQQAIEQAVQQVW
jgi:hypothetical protein